MFGKHHLQLYVCVLSSVFIDIHCEYTYRTEYLEVLLDHFSFTDNRTFPLRYLINDTYWAPKNGPIFLYTGNAVDINKIAQNIGFMWESAPRFKALILFAEHRYYGASLPFGNKSLDGPEYSGYLTTEQALADFVDVVRHVKGQKNKQTNEERRNPVIAFGGSYGGMLAAWMRMKYPACTDDGQLCNEMVMPMCGNGVTDMFWPSEWNFQQFSDQCYTKYKIRPREFMAEKMYGGKDIRKASNIIFSNGMLDPWRNGGVTYSTTSKITLVLMEKAAHFLDLRASNVQDPESVIKARASYLHLFRKWIKNFHRRPHFYEPLIAQVDTY